MPPIKVLLAEDHDLVREGTFRLLERAEDLVVVGEAGDGDEAVRLADALAPDVVVMDMRMPRLNGIEATKLIKAQHPSIRVLIVSAYEDDEYVFPSLEAGADGYLLKSASGKDLIRAIQTIHRGDTALDPRIASKVVGRLNRKQTAHTSPPLTETLTDRELEVLQAVAAGKSNKEVATSLSISTNTVQVHLRSIFGKLDVASRTEAVTLALRRGWISLETKKPE